MKATLLTSAIALLALSATAAPQQTTQQPAPAEQQAANVPQQTLSQAPPAQSGADSPLVAAAKRTGRLGKKPSQVITNETLVKTGGHFTTTKSQDSLDASAKAAQAEIPLPPMTAQTAPAKKAAAAPAKKDDKTTAQKERALKRAVSDYMGESIEEVIDDPTTQEALISKAMERQQAAQTAAEAPKPVQPPPPAQPPQF